MANTTTLQELTVLTKELMLREGIKEYDLNIKGQSKKGENFMGDVTFFSVVPKGNTEKYNLVMKTAKRSEELRKMMPVGSVYRRESYMYRVVFPEMRRYLKSAGNAIQLDYVPKVYSVCDDDRRETLIMENLNKLGYRVWNRKKPMNREHVLLVLENIGKHHAVSIAMRDKVPKVFEKITENLTDIWIEFAEHLDPNVVHKPLIENACQLLKKSGREDLANKVGENILDHISSILLSETDLEDRLVICHGDCWNNNIMFKYKNLDDLHPSKICFVDFQVSMLASPVKDLCYFLYTACDKSLLDDTDVLLQTYFASLSKTLKILGCDSSKCFSYEELMVQWKKYGAYSLILCSMMVKFELLDREEAPDMKQIAEMGGDFANGLNFEMKDKKLYDSRILNIFTHFAEKFL